jgi:stage V sporulation protein SpoVS
MTDETNESTSRYSSDHDYPSRDKLSFRREEKEFSNVLRVKADPPDISEKEKKRKAKALAGAIAHGLRQFGEVKVRAFGSAGIAKAAKSIAIARGYVAVHGFDLYCAPSFIMTEMGDKEITGLSFLVVTSQS